MSTIKDVASRVGVSTGTVDRILHNRGRFSPETAERVFQAVKELNYTPNMHARGLKKTADTRFAAILPEPHLDAGYWHMVLQGVHRAKDEFSAFGGTIKIFTYDYHQQADYGKLLEQITQWNPQALLVAASDSETLGAKIANLQLPVVLIDSDIEALSSRLAYIGQDTYQSGVLAGRLMELLLGNHAYAANRAGFSHNAATSQSGATVENVAPAQQTPTGPLLIINPVYANPYLQQRLAGFSAYQADHFAHIPSVEINQIIEPQEYDSLLQYYFAEPTRLPSGIFVTNASVYDFATYLKSKGEPYTSIPVVGYDLIFGAAHLVEQGVINFVLTQQPTEQGYLGMQTLYNRFVLNQPVEERHIMPLNIITKENVRTFVPTGAGRAVADNQRGANHEI